MYAHTPVMLEEVIGGLNLRAGLNVIDGTVGLGGHARKILEATAPNGRLLGLDLDEAALDSARNELTPFGSRVMLVYGSYVEVGKVVQNFSFEPVQAALLDLGYSSFEIDDPTRGFSFSHSGPLDMRYNQRQELNAAQIVNSWSQTDLAGIIRDYGEDKLANLIAQVIVTRRRQERFIDTLDLAETLARIPQLRRGHYKIHPATRTFQALRIAVNHELENVKKGLEEFLKLLEVGGRLAVISFHSLEDRIVKQSFLRSARLGQVKLITKKPLTPSVAEISKNPRSRSAKLRIVEIIKQP